MVATVVVVLVLTSAVLHALRNFFAKKSQDKEIFVWLYIAIGFLLFLPVYVYFFSQHGLPALGFWLALLSGLLHAVYYVLYAKAFHHGDLSHVYPIMRSSPAIVLLVAVFFLGEQVTLIGFLGILCVIFGVYSINLKSLSVRGFIEPLKGIFNEKGTQFAFLTMLTVASYALVDKIGVGYAQPVVYHGVYFLSSVLLVGAYILRTKEKSAIRKEWSLNKLTIVTNGVIGPVGYMLILFAFTFENVSYVVSMRQISIVIAIALGGYFLKEKNFWIRLFAGSFILAGVLLISFA